MAGVMAHHEWLLRPRWPERVPPRSCLVHTLSGHTGFVNGIAIGPDGRRAVSASQDTTLRIWDLETGACLRTLQGHSAAVIAAAITPDGCRALSGSHDGTIRVWDLDTGAVLQTLGGHSDRVSAIAVAPGGCWAVSGSRDRTVKIWDIESGREVRTLAGHAHWVGAVAVTPDGKCVISASDDHTLRVWDFESGAVLRTLSGHGREVKALAVTPDSGVAVSAGFDNFVRFWRIADGAELRSIRGVRGGAVALRPSADVVIAQSGDSRIRVWDSGNGGEVCHLGMHWGMVNALGVTPDGKYAISAGDDGALKVWDLEFAMKWRSAPGHSGGVGRFVIGQDGGVALSACLGMDVKAWDLRTGSEMGRLRVRAGWPADMALACGVQQLFTTTYDDVSVDVWDVSHLLHAENPQPMRRLKGDGEGCSAIAVSWDGKTVACASYEKLNIWELRYDDEAVVLEGHEESIRALTMSPDGSVVVTAGDDYAVKVWDVSERDERRKLPFDGLVDVLAITSDGLRVIGCSNRRCVIWDISSGREAASYSFGPEYRRAIALARDDSLCVTASYNGTVCVFNVNSGREFACYQTGEPAESCAVAPEGDLIVAGDASGRVHFLELVQSG